ncbi:hypothetical protein ACS386_04800 [Flavobacteriaceae bacterium LMO-SS05]
MNTKSKKPSSFVQILLDKYIYYVVINKTHKQSVAKQFGKERIGQVDLNLT